MRSADDIVVEEALEILLNDAPLCVTMRTPGHDEDLVTGFLWTERIIESMHEVEDISAPAGPRGAPRVHARVSTERPHRTHAFRATSSCGVCGVESAELLGAHGALRVPRDEPRVRATTLFALPSILRHAQDVFSATGGLHAAGLFSAGGELLAAREDIGRHNALDKVIGHALRAQLDTSRLIALVSGRLSFELVAKALSASVPIVAAISAPSSLAIDVGEAHGMTIVGFLRDGTANVYCGEERIA